MHSDNRVCESLLGFFLKLGRNFVCFFYLNLFDKQQSMLI